MEIICVPAIIAITYLLVELYKKFIAKGREKWLNIIPIIAFVIGGALGIAIFYLLPQIIVANNVWLALIVGACSGLSAVGGNQILVQLRKLGIEVKGIEANKEKTDEQ